MRIKEMEAVLVLSDALPREMQEFLASMMVGAIENYEAYVCEWPIRDKKKPPRKKAA